MMEIRYLFVVVLVQWEFALRSTTRILGRDSVEDNNFFGGVIL